MPIGKKAILFDRDGVLNVDSGYVYRYEDIRWISRRIKLYSIFSSFISAPEFQRNEGPLFIFLHKKSRERVSTFLSF